MSINLDIESYCENCDEFEPEVDKETYKMCGFDPLFPEYNTTTVISCKHRVRCGSIVSAIERRLRKEAKNANTK